MSHDDQKAYALKLCVKIAERYELAELALFPVEFREAHQIGSEVLVNEQKKRLEESKDFKL